MRTFVYFSPHAATSGKALSGNLMKAGRIDIAIHVIINAFFLSHSLREDVVLHLVFYGMPDPPKHIELRIKPETNLSKKDVAGLLKRILYKYRPGKNKEVFPGCFIEKKNFFEVLNALSKKGKKIFIMDEKGGNLRDADMPKESVFVIGDHEGFPKKELKRLKKEFTPVSAGPKTYFASQVITILNNELDLRGI